MSRKLEEHKRKSGSRLSNYTTIIVQISFFVHFFAQDKIRQPMMIKGPT